MTVTILITGHCGYIGSALYRTLSNIPEIDKVVGYDLIEGNDILDYAQLLAAMRKHRPDLVIHLAAITSSIACDADPKMAFRVNSHGTYNVVRAMHEIGCEHIIYASTAAIYGDTGKLPYKETHRPQPITPYAASKLLGEYVLYNHYDLNGHHGSYLIYRLFNVVGSSGYKNIDSMPNLGHDQLFTALQRGHVTIYGDEYSTYDGTCERDYVSLKDTCDAFLKGIILIGCKIKLHETINICTGDPSSVKWIIEVWNNISRRIMISQQNAYGRLPYVVHAVGPRRKGDTSKVCGSNKKALTVLNWKPTRKIEDIIFDLAHDKKF